MCCVTIDTEVMLANFFGSPEYRKMQEDSVEIETIEKCAIVLANNLPGYVFYDVSPKAIRKLSEKNKGYILEGKRVKYRGREIDLKQYNRRYTPKISDSIEKIINSFFIYQLYNKQVRLLSVVRG